MTLVAIQAHHWALWALERAEGLGARAYPSTSTIYSPPRRGDIDAPLTGAPPSDLDWLAAQQIGKGVDHLRSIDTLPADRLIIWHGAYAGAPDSRKERIRQMQINREAAYNYVREWKRWVEGWVACYQVYTTPVSELPIG